jgi:predicted PurR-regulated permease PerM
VTDPSAPIQTEFVPARVRVSAGSVAVVLAGVIAAIVVRNIFVAAHRTIGWAVAAALLAMLLAPVVARLQRRLPRPIALAATVVGFGAIAAVVFAAVRWQLADEVQQFVDEAPVAAADLEARFGWARDADVAGRVDEVVAGIEVPSTVDRAGRLAGTATAYFVPGILTLFMLVFGPAMVRGALDLVPAARRPRLERVVGGAVSDARVVVLDIAARSAVTAALVATLSALFGLPASLTLGLVAGLAAALPSIGIVLGIVPAVVFAAAFEGAVAVAVLAVAAIAMQTVANAFVQPAVRRRAGDVGPALMLVVTLIAFELYGIGGATYAVIMLILVMSVVRRVGLEHEKAGAAT